MYMRLLKHIDILNPFSPSARLALFLLYTDMSVVARPATFGSLCEFELQFALHKRESGGGTAALGSITACELLLYQHTGHEPVYSTVLTWGPFFFSLSLSLFHDRLLGTNGATRCGRMPSRE